MDNEGLQFAEYCILHSQICYFGHLAKLENCPLGQERQSMVNPVQGMAFEDCHLSFIEIGHKFCHQPCSLFLLSCTGIGTNHHWGEFQLKKMRKINNQNKIKN